MKAASEAPKTKVLASGDSAPKAKGAGNKGPGKTTSKAAKGAAKSAAAKPKPAAAKGAGKKAAAKQASK